LYPSAIIFLTSRRSIRGIDAPIEDDEPRPNLDGLCRTLPDFAGRLLLLLAVSSRPFCPKFHSYLFIIYLSIYFECG